MRKDSSWDKVAAWTRPTQEKTLLAEGAALERLASELHWKMERLDPSESPEWAELTDHQRSFYRLCVKHLLRQSELVEAALRG